MGSSTCFATSTTSAKPWRSSYGPASSPGCSSTPRTAAETAAEAGRPAVEAVVAAAVRARYHSTLDVAFALLPAGLDFPRAAASVTGY
jgi:hypothetical protein